MTHAKHKSKDNQYIAVKDLAARLGLLEDDVIHWLSRDMPKPKRDHRERPTVPLEFLDRYSTCAEYTTALKRALASERSYRESDDLKISLKLKNERAELLDIYDVYIEDLEKLHRKYLGSANRAGCESSAMAAYLLFK